MAPDGRDVNATYGVLVGTLALLEDPEVTHLAVATDTVIESFRNDLFPGYKSSAGMPPSLLAQFPMVEDALEAMGAVVWRMLEFEADDALATAAHRWWDRADRVLILSPDKDLCQCVVGDRVVLVDRMRRRVIDEPAVVAKFGVPPASIPDYLALVGDSADGVPGLPGWGSRSAAALLSRYGTIEAIPPDPARWGVEVRGAAKLATVLAERAEDVRLYKTLTTLRRDVPLDEELDDLHWRGADLERFAEICAELGFEELVERVV